MVLVRWIKTSRYTLGVLFVGSRFYFTMEPPWQDNKSNISCIPPGEYDYEYLERSASGKYKNCLHIKDVPGRFGILMHSGNKPEQTKGCILPGKKIGWLANTRAVLNSKSALNEIVGDNKQGKLRII